MEFGLFALFDFFRGKQDEAHYLQGTLDICALAEELGFDSSWPGQEHCHAFGICPGPQMFLTAVARETSRIRLGTAVSLLPFEHPLREAEDCAALDIPGNGRLNFGAGRGIIPRHFEGFCVDQAESRARCEESLESMRRAWTENPFEYRDRFRQVPSLSVGPKPTPAASPPGLSRHPRPCIV